MEKSIEHIDDDRYGVRLFKVEPTHNGKIKLTISACSRNGTSHVSVSIEIGNGAWTQIVRAVRQGAFHYIAKDGSGLAVREIYDASQVPPELTKEELQHSESGTVPDGP